MKDIYESPLSSRYADQKMKYLFSPDMKFRTWRKLWIALAETEKELGLNITQEQIDELKAGKEKLMNSAQKLFAKVYENAQGAAGAAGAAGAGPDMGSANTGSAPQDDDVVDGDYREV